MSEWILLQEGTFAYLILFLLLLGGAIGLPIPEDLPLIAAGVLVHEERILLWPAAVVCYTGVLIGDLVIFSVGRKLGPALFQKKWFRSRFPPSRVRVLRYNLEKRSLIMILVARHLFYLRTATFLACGAVRMSPYVFLVADAFAALVSLPIMMGLGYLAAAHVDTLLDIISRTKFVAFFVSIAVIGGIAWYFIRRRATELKPSDVDNG